MAVSDQLSAISPVAARGDLMWGGLATRPARRADYQSAAGCHPAPQKQFLDSRVYFSA